MGLFDDVDDFFANLFGTGGIIKYCRFCDKKTTWKFVNKVSHGCDGGSTDYYYRYRCTVCGDTDDEQDRLYNHG